MTETKRININLIESNTGQIDGLPKNPRFIRDERFEKLVESIRQDFEMMEARPVIVVEFGKKYVAIAGNMRHRACVELGWKDIPVYILPADTDPRKLRAITIKDNVPFGENDFEILANEWDEDELNEWGMELPYLGSEYNGMSEDDLDMNQEFDPIGSASSLHKIVFIFDTIEEGGNFLKERLPDIEYKNTSGPAGSIWQVNMSNTYGKK